MIYKVLSETLSLCSLTLPAAAVFVAFRALMFVSSKFERKLSAISITEQDAELLSRVNAELRQYIDNMDHVKYAETFISV